MLGKEAGAEVAADAVTVTVSVEAAEAAGAAAPVAAVGTDSTGDRTPVERLVTGGRPVCVAWRDRESSLRPLAGA